MFLKCKVIVREFKFGPDRTHLIQAFMKYEAICEAQIIIADIYELVDQAQDSLNSYNFKESISKLDMAHNLETEIPIQFRDKKKLNQLHIKMNHLREEIFYRSKAQEYRKVIYTT